MVRASMACVALLITLTIAGIQSQRPPAGTRHQGKAFRFNKVADGVYHAIGTRTFTTITHGNQIFDKDVVIIGHEFTRDMLMGGKSLQMPLYKDYLAGIPRQIDNLKKRVTAESDAGKKADLEKQLRVAENNSASHAALKPTPPNVTLQTRLTLHRRWNGGDREIQIRFWDEPTPLAMWSSTFLRKRSSARAIC